MKELLEFIVKELVEKPDLVKIESKDDGKCTTYFVTVDSSDIGKVIGKNGRIANSIRTLIRSVAKAKNKYCVIKINDK
ncbi:MAG: KH domain-containing protein [Christensenellales bacterium]